jgi:pyridinium-3,5-bisthiocarboxylic acid mononucleotide nickel chelatase
MAESILYLEPVGGIAGDMFLAAALDLGVDRRALEKALASLPVDGWSFHIERATRHALTGTHLDVRLRETTAGHTHAAEHDHGHAHPSPSLDEQHHHHHHRAYLDIVKLIDASQLPDRAKTRAQAVFKLIGEVEAHIHGTTLEAITFHEVGAVDSIVDICGAAMVLELLGNPRVYCAPPPLGSGSIKIAHGVVPVPVPATLALLKGLPVRFEGVGELTTPTGAALIAALTTVSAPPPMTVHKIGYGMGTKDFVDRANVLRMTLGEASQTTAPSVLRVLECNVDDCSPQWLGHLTPLLLDAGALDVWITAVTMKKGRPGHVLSVLTEVPLAERLTALMCRETTTLGVRFHDVGRQMLPRHIEKVQTHYGEVRVKVATLGSSVSHAAPEFEDCRACAERHGVSARAVYTAAVAEYWRDRER